MSELEEKKPFVINLNAWKMRDFRAFLAAVKDDKWEELFPLIAKVVVSWDYPQALSAEGVEDLGLEDLATVLRAINAAVTNAFTQGN